jgi:RNA polymerase sigma-70 factor (ECF subfamily)
MHADHERPPHPGGPEDFATTRWSVVLRAAKHDASPTEDALSWLCGHYWFPLYAYVRRRIADTSEAQDLTQEFFARLLEKNVLDHAAPERGRFRSFLLSALKNFLANEWDRAKAKKRGGDRRRLALDLDSGESRLSQEPAHDLTPERLFEREWALTLLNLVMSRLEAEFAAAGRARHFELLKDALGGDRERLPYAEIGDQLGLSEEAARQAARRLRHRYREILRAEVAETVGDPSEVDDEIRRLFETFGR